MAPSPNQHPYRQSISIEEGATNAPEEVPMNRHFDYETSLEGYGPEALEAFEVVLSRAGSLNQRPSDVLMDEFEERVDLAAHCYEIFDLAINEMAVAAALS